MESIDQIIHGDSLNVLPRLPAQSVGLVVTDPPYLVRYRDRHGHSIRNDDNPQVLAVFSELYPYPRSRVEAPLTRGTRGGG